jgi:hypothetical protein
MGIVDLTALKALDSWRETDQESACTRERSNWTLPSKCGQQCMEILRWSGPIKKGSIKAYNALQDMISSIRGLGDIWMHSEESQNENRDNPISLEVPKLYERGADGSLVPTISFSHRPQRSCWQPRQRES